MLSVARSLGVWFAGYGRLIPDTGSYATGGFGIYPSPVGRIIGNGGELAVAVVAAVSAGLLPLVVFVRSGRVLPAFVVSLYPMAAWTLFAGMDSLGALLAQARRTLPLAALTHAALLPAVLLAWARRPLAASLVACAGLAVVIGTDYRGVADGGIVRVVEGATVTLAVYALIAAPVVALGARVTRFGLLLTLGGAFAAGLVARGDWQTNVRYLLPAFVALCCDWKPS